MIAYFNLFPEKRETELRTARFPEGDDSSFPSGIYIFTEFYCPDLSCDCQRVLVKVLHASEPESKPKEVATISYSWNDAPDDLWKDVIGESSNPFLDPFHRQAGYADELMQFWYDMLCHDREYAERLQKHYAELRREYGRPGDVWDDQEIPVKPPAVDSAQRKRRHRVLQQKQSRRRDHRRPR